MWISPRTIRRPVHPGTPGAPGRPAFTLIESLATLVLIAIVVPVAMEGIALATATAGLTRHRAQAVSLAQMKLNELIATSEWENGDQSGDFADPWANYHWLASVREWEGPVLQQLDVQVTWPWRGSDRSVTLSTVVLPLDSR